MAGYRKVIKPGKLQHAKARHEREWKHAKAMRRAMLQRAKRQGETR